MKTTINLLHRKAIEALKLMEGQEPASLCWAYTYAIEHLETNASLESIILKDVDIDNRKGFDFVNIYLIKFKPLQTPGVYWFDPLNFDIRVNIIKGLIDNTSEEEEIDLSTIPERD